MASKIKVSFAHRYEDSVGWDDEDNVSPYISIESPEQDIANQRFPDEIVIPMKKIQVQYTYPLSHDVIYEFESSQESGFTRAELAQKICQGYQKIYKEEDDAVSHPGTTTPFMLNRAQSEGPHGIWGHDIGDLLLHTVIQIEDNLFDLGVDS